MSAKFIVNQDRDRIYRFNPNALMYTAPVWLDGILMAINLMMGSACLGTFDDVERAIQEVSSIYNYQDEIYAITGFPIGRAAHEMAGAEVQGEQTLCVGAHAGRHRPDDSDSEVLTWEERTAGAGSGSSRSRATSSPPAGMCPVFWTRC